MSRDSWQNHGWDDRPDDPNEDPEAPQECDLTDVDHEVGDYTVVPCPHCGREISELAERCPSCGDWIVAGGSGSRRKPLTVIIAIVLIIALLLWIL